MMGELGGGLAPAQRRGWWLWASLVMEAWFVLVWGSVTVMTPVLDLVFCS
jgi:hypothetical protein